MEMIAPVLSVKDVDASVAFYSEKLGFTVDFTMAGPEGNNIFAFVNITPQLCIGLNYDPLLELRGSGVDLMLYLPDDHDIDQYYATLQERGVTITTPIQDQFWGDRTFSLHDPDGYLLTFARTVREVPMEEIAAHMSSGG